MRVRKLCLGEYNLIWSILLPGELKKFLNRMSVIITTIVCIVYMMICMTYNYSTFQILTYWVPWYICLDFIFLCLEVICFKLAIKKYNRMSYLSNLSLEELSQILSKIDLISHDWVNVELIKWCDNRTEAIKEIIAYQTEQKVKETMNSENSKTVYDKLNSVLEILDVLLNDNIGYKKRIKEIIDLLNKIKQQIEEKNENSEFVSTKLFIYFNEFFSLIQESNVKKEDIIEILDELKIYLLDILYQIENCKNLHTSVNVSVLLKELKKDNESFKNKKENICLDKGEGYVKE